MHTRDVPQQMGLLLKLHSARLSADMRRPRGNTLADARDTLPWPTLHMHHFHVTSQAI
jgi:hypothetical protein